VTERDEYRTEYGSRADRWKFLAVPVLQAMKTEIGSDGLAVRVGVHRRSIERVLQRVDPSAPHASTRRRYLDAASAYVGLRLREQGVMPGRDRFGSLWCFGSHTSPRLAVGCLVCGRPVTHPLAKYCGKTCKKRAYRKRTRLLAD